MTKKEFESWIEEYTEAVKEAKIELPLSSEEIEKIDKYIGNIPEEYKEAFYMAQDGIFDKFETLPYLLRNYLGALEIKKLRSFFGDSPSLEREDVRAYLEDNAMNAALRVGISVEKNLEQAKESAKALDLYMNGVLMKRTMMPPSDAEKQNLKDEIGDENQLNEAIEENMARQLVLAKTMLLAHIGKYDVINKNGLSRELDVPVYETLAHGNRTNFILPSGENSYEVISAFMGANGGEAAGIQKRTAATHSVKLRRIKNNGILGSESKEQKTYNPFKIFKNQYGMNIAVGGIGRKGPDKNVILGSGESGHMYIRAERGDAKHCASLLIGIEGSEPGKGSYLGNSHDLMGKSAKQSAFLADKNIVGKKIGGRQVDLSGISAEKLAGILNQFSEKYSALQRDPQAYEKLSELNDMLMGKHMDIGKMAKMLSDLDITDKGIVDAISQARRGYIGRINEKDVTLEEFAESIRSKFSQEKACSIAEARFEYAGDNLALAVGAVKELMLIHETRSLGWKIIHPIKNYRENKTISDLVDRLVTEKKFTSSDVASAFGLEDNTFALNWGDELSNDRDAVNFAKEKRMAFKQSDPKSVSSLRSVYNQLREKLGTQSVAKPEPKPMQDELGRIDNGEDLNMDRVSIVIDEEDEANKTHNDVSGLIIPNQPMPDRRKEI